MHLPKRKLVCLFKASDDCQILFPAIEFTSFYKVAKLKSVILAGILSIPTELDTVK